MKRIYTLLMAMIVALLLVGCGATAPEPETGTEGDTAAAADEPVIVFERSGGITGRTETWSIYGSGRVVTGTGETYQVTPEAVSQLYSGLQLLDFSALQQNYIPEDTCCDRYTYTLTVQSEGEPRQVTFLEEAEAPDVLWQSLESVQNFVASLSELTPTP